MGTYEIDTYEMVEQTLTYINEFPDFVDFVKNFDDPTGFMWSRDERLFKIFDGINNPIHSPSSFALTLRVCQNIYKGKLTLEQYKESCGLVNEIKETETETKTHTQRRIFH